MLPAVLMAEQNRPSRKAVQKIVSSSQEETVVVLRGKRMVIVEDEGPTQLQLRRILQLEGMEIVGRAANGQEAIGVVLANKPDVVLMDIRMPVMDGLEASRRILAQYPVCIVMLTAFSDEEYLQEAQKIGTCGYILKPVSAETLVPQLVQALQKFSL
jgi:YesN/AraC family two-component response regulator